jgi:hypothetical protein
MYRSIKELVFDLVHRTRGKIDYKTITEKVKKQFPKSKWKKPHWYWYRSQITSDRGRYKNLFSSEERQNLKTYQNKLSQGSNLKGLEAEKKVRIILERKFRKKFYTRRIDRTLIIGHRSNGEAIKHEFDLVSENQSIIGEVKSDKYTKKAHHNTRFPRILAACKYLEMFPAEKKLLIFTNEKTYKVMQHDLDGLISSDLEIIYINIGKA